MHPHTRGRELALQYLYMHDSLSGKDVAAFPDFLAGQQEPPEPEAAALAQKLVQAVLEHQVELDAEITAVAANWKLHRMAMVDRNILRLGLAELLRCPETPHKVVLNEAVELARRFSQESACAFVNGLLDKLRLKHQSESAPGGEAPPPPAPSKT